jgi:hypothetical protein
VIADQVREPLLHVEGLRDAAYVASLVLHAEEKGPAGGVREGDDGLEDPVGAGKLALELERLAFRPCEQVDEVHGGRKHSEVLESVKLPSSKPLSRTSVRTGRPVGPARTPGTGRVLGASNAPLQPRRARS